MEEITDLQKALSDSHVYLWDERERCHEQIRHLQEEVELVTQQVEELSNLKKIAEKQLAKTTEDRTAS